MLRKLSGLFLMATIGYAGFLGIQSYILAPQIETVGSASDILKTKLQKSLVLVGDKSPLVSEVSMPVAPPVQKTVEAVSSFQADKDQLIKQMNATYDSLLSVSHVFRHEVTEMIGIIKNVKEGSVSAKETYAKNWAKYIASNISKFNMNEASKMSVAAMVGEMQSFIANKGVKKATIKAVKAVAIAQPVVMADKAQETYDQLTKKSIAESIQALKSWESAQKMSQKNLERLSVAWMICVALFSLVALWMSSEKKAIKVVKVASVDNSSSDEPVILLDEKMGFFDEITSNIAQLCQAKGIRVQTSELDNISEIVQRYDLEKIENEVEGFIRTIIRSLDSTGVNTIKIALKESLTRLKVTASVYSEDTIELNMSKVADGFRNLEEKLSTRKGVFNIEQNVGGKNIDFIMQVAPDDKNETKSFEYENAPMA